MAVKRLSDMVLKMQFKKAGVPQEGLDKCVEYADLTYQQVVKEGGPQGLPPHYVTFVYDDVDYTIQLTYDPDASEAEEEEDGHAE